MPSYLYSLNSGFYKIKSDSDRINIITLSSIEFSGDRYKRFIEKFKEEFLKEDANGKYDIILPSLILTKNHKLNKTKVNSFLYNSSIWFRICDYDNNNDIEQTKLLFGKCHEIDLYNSNAIENLEYNLRLQENNFLKNVEGGHGHHITPKLYHNELQTKEEILNINSHDDLKNKEEINALSEDQLDKASHYELLQYNKANFRILLIDDKLEKAELIKKIMSFEFISDAEKEKFNRNIVWDIENIVAHKFSSSEKVQVEDNKTKFGDTELDNSKTQIILVTNLNDAITLLANEEIKFDLILMDYLLAEKDKESVEREYATNFFEWIKDKDSIKPDLEYLRKQLDIKEGEKKLGNKEIIDKLIFNRGPLQKLWIFPNTAFNETFIEDLVQKNVRMIDYYWHISKGADPVTTPYLFLKLLNEFLYLQLEYTIFTENSIRNFLKKSVKGLNRLSSKEDSISISVFNSYMGAELTVFEELYTNRAVIIRDKEKSLFSKYIFDEFIKNDDNKKIFLLAQACNKFYHRCSFGSASDYMKMKNFWEEVIYLLETKFNDNKLEEIRGMNELLNKIEF